MLPSGVEAATDLANFPKSIALFGALVARVPNASWYIKIDTDTFLNVPQLLLVLAAADGRADYLGKSMFLFDLREGQTHFHIDPPQQFTYMQGGMYALSRRAAVAVASCPQRGGPWLTCPNQYFTDVSNSRVGGAMEQSCVRKGATDNSKEDLLVGACVAETAQMHAQMTLRTHPCIVNQGYREEIFAEAGYWRDIFRHEWVKQLCGCPVALHSIKDPVQLNRIGRLVHEECVVACGDAVHATDSICSLYMDGRVSPISLPPPLPVPPAEDHASSSSWVRGGQVTPAAILAVGLAFAIVIGIALRMELVG